MDHCKNMTETRKRLEKWTHPSIDRTKLGHGPLLADQKVGPSPVLAD